MEEINFRKDTGQETKLQIINERLISDHSAFGKIFDTMVGFGRTRARLIRKVYKESYEGAAKFLARRAFDNYIMAKEAGMKVFPTFRISEDGTSILMTNGLLDNKLLGGDRDSLERPLIREIKNWKDFLKQYFENSLRAAEYQIMLPSDVFFFIVDKEDPTELGFVMGDLDTIQTKYNPHGINIYNAKYALKGFFERNVDPDVAEKFLHELKEYCEKLESNLPK